MNRRITRPIQSTEKNGISKSGLNKVSELRRAEIHEAEMKKQAVKESKDTPLPLPSPSLLHSSSYNNLLIKKANAGPVALPTTRGLTDMLGPEVYSPLFQLANMNLPRDRITMNAWNRIFYDTHPIVRNAINLHASFPISKINISHPNKKIQQFFLEQAEKVDLYSVVYGASLEYWKCGETFPYAELDKDTGTWRRITVLNPDFIHVKKSPIGDHMIISMQPDANLQRLVNSTNPADNALKRRIPKHIIDLIRKNQNIPLDDFNISHLKLLSSPYDVRGTSIIVAIYKDLIHYDKLRESKFAQADGMINPLTLVKVGQGPEYRPTQDDINAMVQALESAQYDKDFKIVTHDGVTIERVGFSGAILDVASDIELIINNIYAGLMVPKALIDQESVTYASSSVGLEVLRQRYDIFRNMMKKWLEIKIFAPISEIQDFFEYKNNEKILQVPVVDFNHMNLYDVSDYIQNIGNFASNKQISMQTVCRTLGLSYEEEKLRLREEAIHEAIRNKEIEALSVMRLRELEALDPTGMIPEPPNAPTGGGAPTTEEEGLPGFELPGLAGGPPPMGGELMGGGGEMTPPPGLPA